MLSRIALLGFLVSISSPAFAGWASGGGRLTKYSNNPWWLENTTQVEYCIVIDETQFGVSIDRVRPLILEAIGEWKSAFAAAPDIAHSPGELVPFGQVRLGTQQFVEVDCAAQPNLRFQFGVLTDEQKTYFDDPREFVAAAIRTEYNVATLESRGFVYLAPTKGPLAPNSQQFHPDAWSVANHAALRVVLRHELGHVFGLPHGDSLPLMDERTPEFYTERESLEELAGRGPSFVEMYLRKYANPTHMFVRSLPAVQTDCHSGGLVDRHIFAIPSHATCVRVTVEETETHSSLEISYATDPSGNFTVHGRMDASSIGIGGSGGLTVYLPETQSVFTKLPSRVVSRISAEHKVTKRTFSGIYRSADGKQSIPLFVESPLNGDAHAFAAKGTFIQEDAISWH